MARPAKPENERYTRRMMVRITEGQDTALRTSARRLGMSFGEFVRDAVNARVKPTAVDYEMQRRAEAARLRTEVRRIGNNFNQAVRCAHENGDPIAVGKLNEIKQLLLRLLAR